MSDPVDEVRKYDQDEATIRRAEELARQGSDADEAVRRAIEEEERGRGGA